MSTPDVEKNSEVIFHANLAHVVDPVEMLMETSKTDRIPIFHLDAKEHGRRYVCARSIDISLKKKPLCEEGLYWDDTKKHCVAAFEPKCSMSFSDQLWKDADTLSVTSYPRSASGKSNSAVSSSDVERMRQNGIMCPRHTPICHRLLQGNHDPHGVCIRRESLACGPGTIQKDGECVLDQNHLRVETVVVPRG